MSKAIERGVRALAQNFGRLVANHRRLAGLSQEQLAARADISEGMVAKIETGATGARFPTIVRIAQALAVDPAELFYSQFPRGRLNQGKRREIITQIEELSEDELDWFYDLAAVAFRVLRHPVRPVAAAPAGTAMTILPPLKVRLRRSK